MADPKTCYYARSISLYGKEQSLRDIETLAKLGFVVTDPNGQKYATGYAEAGMSYFKSAVAACDALAFRAHADGTIPAGVAFEIGCAREAGMPVIEMPSCVGRRTLGIKQTREWLREAGHR